MYHGELDQGVTLTVGSGLEALHGVGEPAVAEVTRVDHQAEAVDLVEVVHDHLPCAEVSGGRQLSGGDQVLYSTDDPQHADLRKTNLSLKQLVHNIGDRLLKISTVSTTSRVTTKKKSNLHNFQASQQPSL